LLYDTNADPNNDSNLSAIQTLAQQLTVLDTAHRLGLTTPQITRLFAPASLSMMYTGQGQSTRPASEIIAGFILAYAGALLIVILVSTYANIVAAGVAEEKSSRVMEILMNAATPFQLLIGKIVGIGAACLTQMTSLVVVGIGALLLQTPLQGALFGAHAGSFIQYLTDASIPFYLLFLLYVLLAFFLYAALYAGLGATVKQQDEVQNATILPRMLVTVGYLLFFLGATAPNAAWTKVLSYVPFWTPTLMLVRIALGTVAWWEIVVTIAIMLVAILASTWFAARLYRYGVLMYGQRPGFGQLLKLVRMK
jgi:ABC-2 type transport system permease protein